MTSLPDFSDRPVAQQRFAKQLQQLLPKLNAAKNLEDPALALYQSNTRQVLFYLEALARIYRNIHNFKRFERLRIIFKVIEDQLGRIDYYDGFIKELSIQENFPAILLDNLKEHYSGELKALNRMLQKQDWINDDSSMIKKIWEELEDADWKEPMEDRCAVGETIIADADLIEASYDDGILNFRSLENGVHKFRRELRWISIYAQALDGLIQLRRIDTPNPKLVVYLSKEVIANPFNKLPPLADDIEPIYIQAPNFYALSWLIEEGGKLKDEGLRVICIEDAIREVNFVEEKEVKQTARRLAVNSTHSLRQIKEKMEILADDFIHDARVLWRIKRDIRRSIEK